MPYLLYRAAALIVRSVTLWGNSPGSPVFWPVRGERGDEWALPGGGLGGDLSYPGSSHRRRSGAFPGLIMEDLWR